MLLDHTANSRMTASFQSEKKPLTYHIIYSVWQKADKPQPDSTHKGKF